jgi:hypothetical protein
MCSGLDIFKRPGGSMYFYLRSSNFAIVKLEILEALKKYNSEKSIRLIADSNQTWQKENLKDKLYNLFSENNLNNLEILEDKTTFFKLDKKEVSAKLSKIKKDVDLQLLKANEVETEIDLENYLNFQINSFGIKINELNQIEIDDVKTRKIKSSFYKDIKNFKSDLYIIKNINEEFLGTFSFSVLEKEIQLHSVAGIAKGLKLQKGSKLASIVAVCLHLFLNSKKYTKQTKITLSSSKEKLAKKYQELGFVVDKNRFGLIIKQK